ncbi:hypothetical protein GCM10009743_30230 [Kribbella swartbergensis]
MERADWLDGAFDSAQARFLMLTAVTHHRISSPIRDAQEVLKRRCPGRRPEVRRGSQQMVCRLAGSARS